MLRRFSLALAAVLALAGLAHAQGAFQPKTTVKFIVPFPAGGINDVLARIVADKLQAKWGQPIIIEQKTGAGGNIGADLAAQAEPDGYTLFVSAPGPLAINQNLYKKLSYKPRGLRADHRARRRAERGDREEGSAGQLGQGTGRATSRPIPARWCTAARATARRRISPPTCS